MICNIFIYFFIYLNLLFTENCQAKIILKGQLYEKYGQKYLHFENSETKIKYGKGFVDFGDVFGRDTLISKKIKSELLLFICMYKYRFLFKNLM